MEPDNRYFSSATGQFDVNAGINASFVKQLRMNQNNGLDDEEAFVFGKSNNANGRHENGVDVDYDDEEDDDDDDDDDLGPESNVDAVDDAGDLTTLANVSRELFPEKDPRDEVLVTGGDESAVVENKNLKQHELSADAAENVGDSEDSDDEWNYYRVDPDKENNTREEKPAAELKNTAELLYDAGESQKERDNKVREEKEKEASSSSSSDDEDSEREVRQQLTETEIREKPETENLPESPLSTDPAEEDKATDMDFQLNPNAAEFIPVSPSPTIPNRLLDMPIAGSPLKQTPMMDDIRIPSPSEFQEEASHRPSEIEGKITSPLNGDLMSEVEEQRIHKPVFNLDESEVSSTRAEFGDESTASFLTATDYHRNPGFDGSFTSSCGTFDQDPMTMSFGPGDFNPLSTHQVDLNAVHDLTDADLLIDGERENDVHPELAELISPDTDQPKPSAAFPDHQVNEMLGNVEQDLEERIEKVSQEVEAMNLKNANHQDEGLVFEEKYEERYQEQNGQNHEEQNDNLVEFDRPEAMEAADEPPQFRENPISCDELSYDLMSSENPQISSTNDDQQDLLSPTAPMEPERMIIPESPEEPIGTTTPEEQIASPVSQEQIATPVPEELVASPVPHEEVASPVSQEEIASPVPQEHVASPVPEEHAASPIPQEHVISPVPQEEIASPVPHEEIVSPVPQEELVSPVPQENIASPVPEEQIPSPVPEQQISSPVPEEHIPSPVPQEPLESPVPQEPVVSTTSDEHLQSPVPEEPLQSPLPDEPITSPDTQEPYQEERTLSTEPVDDIHSPVLDSTEEALPLQEDKPEADLLTPLEEQKPVEEPVNSSIKLSESLQEFTGLEQQLNPTEHLEPSNVPTENGILEPKMEVEEALVASSAPLTNGDITEAKMEPLIAVEPEIKSDVAKIQESVPIVAPVEPVKEKSEKDKKEEKPSAKIKPTAKAPSKPAPKTAKPEPKSTLKVSPTSPSKAASSPRASAPLAKKPSPRPKTGASTTTSTLASKTTAAAKPAAKPAAPATRSAPVPPKPKPAATGASRLTATKTSVADKKPPALNGEVKSTIAKTRVSSTSTAKPLTKSAPASRPATAPLAKKPAVTAAKSTGTVSAAAKPAARPKTATSTLGTAPAKAPRTSMVPKSPATDKQIKETANKQISSSRTVTSTLKKTSTTSVTATATARRVTSTTTTTTTGTKKPLTTRISAKSTTANAKVTTTKAKTTTTKLQNGVCEVKEAVVEVKTTIEDVPKKDPSPLEAGNDNQLIINAEQTV